MARPDTVKFCFRRFDDVPQEFENDLVAQLPGLLISMCSIPESSRNGHGVAGLRFDFVEDWYSITAYLDETKSPTGYYDVAMQSPLYNDSGVWKGIRLILEAEVGPDWEYNILNEEEFIQAVEDGWMRVFAAAKARAALRDICRLLDDHCLPQEVMDALSA